MADAFLVLSAGAAVFAVLFIVMYLRILVSAEVVGPTPMSWILFAVGASLIAASAVLEAVLIVEKIPLVFHTEKVYFMIGNIILFTVLFRVWHSIIGNGGKRA